MPFLTAYTPPNLTNPQHVIIFITNYGITALIYETYLYDPYLKKRWYELINQCLRLFTWL